MKKFIYVFNDDDKDRLIKAGFILLKEDKKNDIYTFSAINENDDCFVDYSEQLGFLEDYLVVSDILTF